MRGRNNLAKKLLLDGDVAAAAGDVVGGREGAMGQGATTVRESPMPSL